MFYKSQETGREHERIARVDDDDRTGKHEDEAQNGLTPIQQTIFEMVEAYLWKYGHSPSYREIAARVPGVRSLSQIGPHLTRLTELGYLDHQGGIARGTAAARREIPIKGRIAAGEPLEKWEDGDWQMLDVELRGLPPSARSELYALQVKGDSMIDAGILDGDWLIVREASSAPDGTIVVALDRSASPNGAATVKRVFTTETHVRLQPANPKHTPRVIPAAAWDRDWEIQGIVTAIYRRY